MAWSGPYHAFVVVAVAVFHPIVTSRSLVVDKVAGLHLHAWVDHIDGLEVALVEIVVQPLRVGKLLGREGEDLVVVHIVDIHPDDIRRNLMAAQQVGHFLDTCVGLVAELTLLVAKRPKRRQLHVARQVGHRLHELLRRVALDDDDAEGWSVALEDDVVAGGDALPPCIVGDNAESGTVGAKPHHPGMTLIEMRSAVDAVGRCVDIPQTDLLAIAAQRSCHFARAVEVDLATNMDGGDRLAVALRERRAQRP